jgi:hypothetical protein
MTLDSMATNKNGRVPGFQALLVWSCLLSSVAVHAHFCVLVMM